MSNEKAQAIRKMRTYQNIANISAYRKKIIWSYISPIAINTGAICVIGALKRKEKKTLCDNYTYKSWK
jgi:hypothetical protein